MIYDVVYFFDEWDLLEIRLNLLDKYVDKFVIVQGTGTFRGESQNVYWDGPRVNKWRHKIINHLISDMPQSFDDPNCDQEILKMGLASSNVTREHICWLREFYYKEHVKHALKGLKNSDIVFISDCDEIWNPKVIKYIKSDIYRPIQLPYLYYLNERTSQPYTDWTGTVATRYRNIKNACINHIRTHSKTDCVKIANMGWHFALLGDSVNRKLKDEPTGYSPVSVKSKEIDMRIDESDLPQWLLDNRKTYAHLFKD